MKILLSFLMLLIATQCNSQTAGSPLGSKSSYIPVKGGIKIDSANYLPKHFPSSYTSIDSTGLFWYDLITKHLWYHNGASRKETVPRSYVDSAVASASGGALDIGNPIGGGDANKFLYSDGSGNLNQTGDMTFLNIGGDILGFNSAGVPTALSSGSLSMISTVNNIGINISTGTAGVNTGIEYVIGEGGLSLKTPTVTGAKTQKFQDDTGFLALLKNLPTFLTETADGTPAVFTYTFSVTGPYIKSFAQSQNEDAAVDYSTILANVLTIHVSSVTPGSANLKFSVILK